MWGIVDWLEIEATALQMAYFYLAFVGYLVWMAFFLARLWYRQRTERRGAAVEFEDQKTGRGNVR